MEKQHPDIHKEISQFSNYLKQKGLKITNQRLLVAEKIFTLGSHFTVDSLAEELKDRRGEISRATIYRIVSLLVESGQLTEHDFGASSKYYEYIPARQHHDHIVCQDCGHIEEFYAPAIEKIQTEVAAEYQFELTDHSQNLYGRCKILKEKGRCERKESREPKLQV
jgi:Fur family ferric uptake transcriptional regulator